MNTQTINSDKGRLLAELTLQRDLPAAPANARFSWVVGAIITALAVFAVARLPSPNKPSSVAQVSSRPLAEATVPSNKGSEPTREAVSGATLEASGYVVARQTASVSANATGEVRQIYFEEGRSVQGGDIMAKLDDRLHRARLDWIEAELASAQSAVAVLEVAHRHAQTELSRAESLASQQLISQSSLDDLRARLESTAAQVKVANLKAIATGHQQTLYQTELDKLVIRAPFSGVVVRRTAQIGEIVSPVNSGAGSVRPGIAVLVDMRSLEVEADISENYIKQVHAGQPVRINLNAYPSTTYAGQVLAIIPSANRNKATIRVRIGMEKPDAKVMPEMGAKVSFLAE